MNPTRRLWAVLGLTAGATALAVVLATPVPLVGAVLLGAWVLTRQYLFVRATGRFVNDVTISQVPAQEWIRTEATLPVTLTATLDRPSRLTCRVKGGLPTGATAPTSFGLEMGPETTSVERTVDVTWPVAGRHTFDRPTLVLTDGLFEQSLTVPTDRSVTVQPRGPRNVHVGEGGDRYPGIYGEHAGGGQGSGIEPAQLREYVPGDTINQIDWNATARLNTPYVREFEAETDQETLIVFDHREALAVGPPAETKLAYLREVGLSVLSSAEQLGDPLGLLTVGDEGITTRYDPTTTRERYERIRQTLLGLTPMTAGESTTGQDGSTGRVPSGRAVPESPIARRGAPQTAAEVRESLATLAADSPFERTVRPFYDDRQSYDERIETDPLFGGLRQMLANSRGQVFTVLCSDDSTPAELREAVRIARSEGGPVLVLLAPTVLYEPGGLSDLEAAYERYVRFEELRRDLASFDGVTALEVGPGDRLSTVIEAGRETRRSVGGGRL